MNIEKYSCYNYIIHKQIPPAQEGFTYEILLENNYLGHAESIESEEWYDTEQEARFAAIGHITLLENGEG